jgi:hypothetical protein
MLSSDNPLYNTIIVFTIIMMLLYCTKPSVIYDNRLNEFRQFGTTDGKTLLPIYVVAILLAIILYVFFHYLAIKKSSTTRQHTDRNKYIDNIKREQSGQSVQQQIRDLQSQIQQLLNNQLLHQYLSQTKINQPITPIQQPFETTLPNNLNV